MRLTFARISVILAILAVGSLFLMREDKVAPSPTLFAPVDDPPFAKKEDFFGKDASAIKKEELGGKFGEILDPFEPITDVVEDIIDIDDERKKPRISESEIFKKLFPDFYLEDLGNMQREFIKLGWMATSSLRVFDSEKNVLAFLRDGVEVFVEQKFYGTEEKVKTARNAISIYYPRLLEARKKEILGEQASLRRFFNLEPQKITGLALHFLPRADAQINIPGIWGTSPQCYKAINPSQTQKGKDLFSFCCNCGIKFYGYIPVYMHDCGPFAGSQGNSLLCDVHLGCLNETCEGFNNAIWDGPGSANLPYSFKCGCDDPEKTQQGGEE